MNEPKFSDNYLKMCATHEVREALGPPREVGHYFVIASCPGKLFRVTRIEEGGQMWAEEVENKK